MSRGMEAPELTLTSGQCEITRREALQSCAAGLAGACLGRSAPAAANPPQDGRADPAWFHTLLGNWSGAEQPGFLDFVSSINPEVLQAGFFGPQFYSLVETEHFNKCFGPPAAQGTRAALDAWRRFVALAHRRKHMVIGQFAFSLFWGDEHKKNGLFEYYERHWDEKILGPRPGKDLASMMQVVSAGRPVIGPDPEQKNPSLSREGIPNRYGCLNNPDWRALCKAMVKAAVDIGLDGLMTVFNFRYSCGCPHCDRGFKAYLKERYSPALLKERFGIDDLPSHRFPIIPGFTSPDWSPLAVEAHRWTDLALKEAWDEVFVRHGRALKKDLLLGAWYHCHWLQPEKAPSTNQIKGDERVALPLRSCAAGESFLWYCLGSLAHQPRPDLGALGDAALECKYMYALGEGRPFIPNKYDGARPRLTLVEGPAFGGVARGMHWPAGPGAHLPVYRQYYGFLRRHAELYHPTKSYAEAALVLPRLALFHGDVSVLEPIQALARALLAQHVLFDLIPDEAVTAERLRGYRLLLCPQLRYLDDQQVTALKTYVEQGGKLYGFGELGTRRFDGGRRDEKSASLLDMITALPAAMGKGTVWRQPTPQDLQKHFRSVRDGSRWDVLQRLAGDLSMVETSWKVQVNAFIQPAKKRLVLHAVNYDYKEMTGIEGNPPTQAAPAAVRLRLPAAARAGAVRFLTPEKEETGLHSRTADGFAVFTLPAFYVYGLAVVEY